MAAFLKIVSGIYLVFVWLVFLVAISVQMPRSLGGELVNVYLFFIAITLSIPAVALFAFGQVVGDVRAMRHHLKAMRQYYEPAGPN